MKKIFFVMIVALLLSNCASTPTSPDELDMAIRDASDYLNDNIPRGSKIVILNIQSDSLALSEYIIEEMIANAVNDRIFTVVDRAQLDLIRQEQNFQLSGEVDDNTALAIGRFFGAQTIVSGRVSELGDRYRMSIRALNVQTAQVQGQYNRNMTAGRTITALMRNRGNTSIATQGTRTTAPAAAQATTNNRQTAAQPVQSRGAENGTYTMWPRPRAMQAGLPINFYIAQITASNDYIVIFFARSGTGDFSNGHSGFWEIGDFSLQDLDNPSRFYTPVQARETTNGMGTIWSLSFRRFPATRFKMTANGKWPYGTEPIVWEEIILDKPD
ncbi:MAG: penicillin-binding protein activator LpoB [Treponema sp.]|nr:penicillin-binding protein activator LpoB [Treponema sp.]